MKKLTVTHFTPTFFSEESLIGGGERYVINVCKAANLYGADRVVCRIVSVSSKETGRRSIEGTETTILPPAGKHFEPFVSVSAHLADALADSDVVHIHQPFSRAGEIALVTARLLRKVVIVTDHGMEGSKTMRRLKGIDLADLLLCVSEFSANLMRRETQRPIKVLTGPVDTKTFERKTECPKKLHALTVARLLPHKGIDRIIRALPSGLPLVVCGRPYDKQYLSHLKRIAKGKKVRFVTTASDTDLLKLYREATVTILASTYVDCYGNTYEKPELMGFTLLESMAVGTPVLCSRVGGMPELVQNGETGHGFDSDSELADYLGKVASGAWPIEGAAEECIRHVQRNFSLQAVGPKLADMYETTYEASRSRR